MIFQSSWIMMVIWISIENGAADRSNQPNSKSYTPRKLALDKEKDLFQSFSNFLAHCVPKQVEIYDMKREDNGNSTT